MINESEIRIGNWFKHKAVWSYRQKEGPGECKEFYFQWTPSDWYALGECTLSLEDIEPIVLNKDLVKDNFKHDGQFYFFQPEFENIHYRLVYFHGWILSKGFINFNNEIGIVRYVHELQNMIYWNSGKTELIIKEIK